MTKTCKKRVIISLLLCLVLGLGMFTPFLLPVSAAETTYSNVLDDLEKDENFNPADFPENPTDYSLQVITVAEGENGELFVYVYQPSATTKFLLATSITIDSPINDTERSFKNYSLSLLGSYGVFQKYRVNSFALKETPVRKYCITEIFRSFDSDIDAKPENDNTISEKAYVVGKMWTLTETNNNVSIDLVYEDVIDVTEKHVGYIKYNQNSLIDGFLGNINQIHSHYVAFSTDRPIDSILEVDLVYETEYVYTAPVGPTNLTTSTERTTDKIYDTLTSEQVLEINTSGFFSDYYKYNRIQSVEAFYQMEEKDIENIEVLEGKEWILRFYETEWFDDLHSVGSQGSITTYQGSSWYTKVSNVALLRIEYEYDGRVYNLGVVDDKQTAGKDSDGIHGGIEDMEWWQKIMMLLSLIIIGIVIIILFPILKFILDIVWWAIKGAFFVVLWLLSAPFRLIAWLLR